MIPGTLQLRRARRAASKRGLEATLTITDWYQTCADLEYRCAYCGEEARDATIDHFLPMVSGGGTTITNCLLSCRQCNHLKGPSRPEAFLAHNPVRLAALRSYLAQRRPGQGPHPFFWAFPCVKKERTMNRDDMHVKEHPLASGMQITVATDDHRTVLQLQQLAASERDPATISFQVATGLSASECLSLAATLLQAASARVERQEHEKPLTPSWEMA
jgi:hypothetical protein